MNVFECSHYRKETAINIGKLKEDLANQEWSEVYQQTNVESASKYLIIYFMHTMIKTFLLFDANTIIRKFEIPGSLKVFYNPLIREIDYIKNISIIQHIVIIMTIRSIEIN